MGIVGRGLSSVCVVAALFGCDHGSSPPPIDAPADAPRSSAKDITAFSFLAADNPALIADATATITGTDITVTTRFPETLAGLKATFATTGIFVTVDTVLQTSGVTGNDFGPPVLYT